MKIRLLVLAALAAVVSCAPRERIPAAPDYDSPEAWYVSDRGADVDLFYISSTETFDATVGRKVYHYAQAADSAACPGMRAEMEGVDRILAGGLNFYSPFYRQMSMETYLDTALIDSRFPVAMADVRVAFRHYVDEFSDGRPFVLAGFSQGGELLVGRTASSRPMSWGGRSPRRTWPPPPPSGPPRAPTIPVSPSATTPSIRPSTPVS